MAGKHRAPSKTGKRVAAVATMTAIGGVATVTAGAGTANAAGPDWGPIIKCESGGDPQAQNSSSTASGLFQFINGTWKAYGGSTARAKDASVSEQYRVANRAFAAEGYGPWAASNGCHGLIGKEGSSVTVKAEATEPKVEKKTEPKKVAPAPKAPVKKNLLDCKDFNSQYEAQKQLSADKSDPNRLDADSDGEACETYPYKGVKSTKTADPVKKTALETQQVLPVVTPKVQPQGAFTPGGSGEYTVKSGDTLSQLAVDHKTTVNVLVDLNKDVVEHKDWIYVGEHLRLR